jgi:aspartate kinase
MSGIVVAKFGGSSLADAVQFDKVRSIVFSDSRRKFVVPSSGSRQLLL